MSNIAAEDDGPLETTRSLTDWLTDAPQDPPTGEQITAVFDNVTDWATSWLAPTLEIKTGQGSAGGANWCPQWFDHPQVVLRLSAAWREWETARTTETMSRWWLDFDSHLAAITGEHGPFARCRNGHQLSIAPLADIPADRRDELTGRQPAPDEQ